MAELERIANHILDVGAICNDVAFSFMLAQCTVLREQILHVNQTCFGHRLLMDTVVPGGVGVDITRESASMLRHLVKDLRKRFKKLANLYDDMPSLQARTVGTGVLPSSLAHRFGVGGFVGRASSQAGDARKIPAYPPYDDLEFDVPVHPEGDVNARVWVRIEEVRASFGMIEQILDNMPGGPLYKPIPTRGGEGMALIEGFRGEILMWVRVSEVGRVVRCHARDPSWFQWPLLEAAIEGNIVADFPCATNRSIALTPGSTSEMAMLRLLLRELLHGPHTIEGPRPIRSHRTARTAPRTGRRRASDDPAHPRGRRRFVQWLRTGNPCGQRPGLRSGAVRHPFRRQSPSRRCPACYRSCHGQYGPGIATDLRGHFRIQMGGGDG